MNKLDHKIILLFLLLSMLISGIWFRSGKFIGGGEEGLSLYNPEISLHRYLNPWYDLGGGYLTASYLPRTILMSQASLFKLVLQSWQFQGLMYCSLFFSGLSGMYLFARRLGLNRYTSFISATFYLFNLYSLSQVWMRFLYTSMFAWSLLPFWLIFSTAYISTGRWKWLIGAISLSVLFSNAFGIPSFIFTIWTPIAIYSLWQCLHSKKIKGILYFVVLALSWAIFHSWWLWPMMNIGIADSKPLRDIIEGNIASLQGSSSFFPSENIVLLTQKYLFGQSSPFYSFYSNFVVKIIEIAILFVAVIGVVKTIKAKKYSWLILILVCGWFISKGSNPPLGLTFFSVLFSKFPAAMSLRNSYEKFGLVFLLPYSVLFGIGINTIKGKTSYLLVALSLFIAWPLLTGDVYTSRTRVIVPESYRKINRKIISEMPLASKLLHVPMILGEGVSYVWGYSGGEASEYLFKNPSWGRESGPEKFNNEYSELSKKLVAGEINIEKIMSYGIGGIIVHKDYTNEFIEKYGNPDKIQTLIETIPLAQKQYEDQHLTLFILDYEKIQQITTSKKADISKISQRYWKINGPLEEYKIRLNYSDNPCWHARSESGETYFKDTSELYPEWSIPQNAGMISIYCKVYPFEP